MNKVSIFILVILMLGLVLFSFLGNSSIEGFAASDKKGGGDEDFMKYKSKDEEVISFGMGQKGDLTVIQTDKSGKIVKYTGEELTDTKLKSYVEGVAGKNKKTFTDIKEGPSKEKATADLINYNGTNYLSLGPPIGSYLKLTPETGYKTTFSNSESDKPSKHGITDYDPKDLDTQYHKNFLGKSLSEKEDDDMWDPFSGDLDSPSSWSRFAKHGSDSSEKTKEKPKERTDRGGYRNSRYDDDYDNYNHFNKKTIPSIFYGPNGTTAKVMNTYGKYVVIVSDEYGKTTSYHPKSGDGKPRDNDRDEGMRDKEKDTVYHSQSGGKAEIYTSPRSQEKIIKVTDVSGNTIIYSSTTSQTYDTSIINKPDANVPAYSESKSNTASKTSASNPAASNTAASNPAASNTASKSPSGSGYDYKGSLPQGIPKSMIPKGDEDLYILKSEVVPPVCPACPPQIMTCPKNDSSSSSSSSSSSTKCPPCPPCARCPEPAFSCQKVPNYSTGTGNPYLPVPVLSSFSSFGM